MQAWSLVSLLVCGCAASAPDAVHTLTFGFYFNQPLTAESIPDSVHTLTFGRNFNQPLIAGSIPDSVHTLTFGSYFDQPLTADFIPNAIINLNLYCTYHFFPICKNINVNIYIYNPHYYNSKHNRYAKNILSITEIYYGTETASYPKFIDVPKSDHKIMTLSIKNNMKSAKS